MRTDCLVCLDMFDHTTFRFSAPSISLLIISVIVSTVQQHNQKRRVCLHVKKYVCVCLCTLTDDRHALAVGVEVEQRQHFVGCLVVHLLDGDGVLCARQKHVAKISGCRHQGALIRRRRLVHQIT